MVAHLSALTKLETLALGMDLRGPAFLDFDLDLSGTTTITVLWNHPFTLTCKT
jgi:hypothetical protein